MLILYRCRNTQDFLALLYADSDYQGYQDDHPAPYKITLLLRQVY